MSNTLNTLKNKKIYDFFDFITESNYYKNFIKELLPELKKDIFKNCNKKNLYIYENIINNFITLINNIDIKNIYSENDINSIINQLKKCLSDELDSVENILNLENSNNEEEILEYKHKLIEFQKKIYEFHKVYKFRNNNKIINKLYKNKNENIIDFFKKTINNLTNNNINNLKDNIDILNIFFIKLSVSENSIKEDFLQEIIKDKNLANKIFNNPNIVRYFIECFITNNNFNNKKYFNIFNELCTNNYQLAFKILTNEKFNKEKHIKYHYANKLFVENILIITLENISEKEITEITLKINDCNILRFFLLEQYKKLNNKNTRTNRENSIFNNIKKIFNTYIENKNNNTNLQTLTELSINKICKKEISNKIININNDNFNELLDLIYLGIIDYNNIKEINNTKLLNKLIYEIRKRIDNQSITEFILNKKLSKFIANILDTFDKENKEKFLNEIFSLFNNTFNAYLIDSSIYNKFLKSKEFVIKELNYNKINNNYYKINKLERICFDLNNISIDDINFVREFIKNPPKKYENFKICYNGRNFCKIKDLKSNIDELFGFNNKKIKTNAFNIIFENENNTREFKNYEEFTNFVNITKNNNLINLKNFLDNSSIKFNKNDRIKFIKKTVGGSSGIIIENIKNERFFIKKENIIDTGGNTEIIKLLLGDNITPEMYTELHGNDTIILTKGVGEQGLEDNKYKTKNNNHFLNKIENNETYRENFTHSFCEIFIKGYLNCVVDIRKDNIRVTKDGKLILIDYIYEETASNKFDRDNICFFKNDINQCNFVENIFNNIFFKQQLFRHFNLTPQNDGTKQIFEFLLEKIGKDKFEEILINQIINCISETKKNYKSNLNKLKNQKEKDILNKIYNTSLNRYNELLLNINTYYPKIYKKILLNEQKLKNNKSDKSINYNFEIRSKKDILNCIIEKITNIEIKNEIQNFIKNKNPLSDKTINEIQSIIKNINNFSIDEKNNFLSKILHKSLNLKTINNTIRNSIKDDETYKINALCNFSDKLIQEYTIKEEKRLQNEDKNNANKLSKEFKLPNYTNNNLVMNFPYGNFKELFKNGINIILEDINNNIKYNAFFKSNKNINCNIINFITLARTYGLIDACGMCGVDIEIRNYNNELCNSMNIFNKKLIDEKKICTLDSKFINNQDLINLEKALNKIDKINHKKFNEESLKSFM